MTFNAEGYFTFLFFFNSKAFFVLQSMLLSIFLVSRKSSIVVRDWTQMKWKDDDGESMKLEDELFARGYSAKLIREVTFSFRNKSVI
eukprot:UN00658